MTLAAGSLERGDRQGHILSLEWEKDSPALFAPIQGCLQGERGGED